MLNKIKKIFTKENAVSLTPEQNEYKYEFFSEEIAYLNKFLSTNYKIFHEAEIEFKTTNGYGPFPNSEEVYQSFGELTSLLEAVCSDMRIPEHYASPETFICSLTEFSKFLFSKIQNFESMLSKYTYEDPPSFPINEALTNYRTTYSAITYVLNKITQSEKNEMVNSNDKILEKLFLNFGKVCRTLENRYNNRGTIQISDEYDVQDLLHALLKPFFDDIRPEEWNPSYAGSSSRTDFLLKNEQIMIETKMTRNNLKDKEIGEQLVLDIAKYKTHPNCKFLYCFVYDPTNLINNENGLITDLEKQSTKELPVRVFIGH